MAALVALQALAFRAIHAEALQALPARVRLSLWAFLAVTFSTLLPVLGLGLWSLHRRLLLPWHRLRERLNASLEAEPGTPIELEGAPDAGGLARSLNEIARRRDADRARLEAQVARATAELDAERTRWRAMLDAGGAAVVACSAQGLILAYSRAAWDGLGESSGLGIGRPVDHLIDAQLLLFVRDSLREQQESGIGDAQVEFRVETLPPEFCDVRAEPLPGEADGGLLLVFASQPAPGAPDARNSAPAAAPPRRRPHARAHADRGAPLERLRYVVFDTETTGLHPSHGDQVVALAAVAVAGGRIISSERIDTLIDPGRPIGRAALQVHGISDEQVRGQPSLTEVLPRLARMSEGAVLVAHNAAFDLSFIRQRERECGLRFDHPVLDTMLLSALVHPHQRSHSLDHLAERFGLRCEARHSALGDAELCAQALLKLIPLLGRMGVVTLDQALRASRTVPLAGLHY
jgi:DNA polymerase III epsilon subunit family exonuclease